MEGIYDAIAIAEPMGAPTPVADAAIPTPKPPKDKAAAAGSYDSAYASKVLNIPPFYSSLFTFSIY